MKSFRNHFNEVKDTHCSDKCCGADVKAEDCDCPADCAHCNCNAVKESFDPKHPKVVAARKAHKAGIWNGNVDKNGNAIVHINGKPHTVTKGDPAAKYESTNQLDELSPATLKSYKKKAVKQYKQSANKRMPGGGDYGSATKAAQDKHQKRFDKRHKGIGSEIKRTTDSDIHLKDPKGLVRKDPKANSLTGKPAPYKNKAESYESIEQSINEAVIDIINENNITIEQLENMTEAELQELLSNTGKVIGGTAKAAYGLSKLAGLGVKTLAKTALMNKQGNIRGTAAAKADKAQAKNDKLKSTLANIQDKRRNNIKAKLADRQSIRLKKTIARHKAKLKQTQNRPKPSN